MGSQGWGAPLGAPLMAGAGIRLMRETMGTVAHWGVLGGPVEEGDKEMGAPRWCIAGRDAVLTETTAAQTLGICLGPVFRLLQRR